MRIAYHIVDNDYDSLDTNNFLYMYQHEDISGIKGLPVGWYQLWSLFSLAFASSQS